MPDDDALPDAQKYVDVQSEEFQRLGVFGDWENPYMTMSPAYEGVIARPVGPKISPLSRDGV